MPTIAEDGPFTLLMEYEVEAGRQQEMIDGVTAVIARDLASNPGLIAASFHAAEDGVKVYNYAQWTSREAWLSATPGGADHPTTAAIIAVLDRCGGRRTSVQPIAVAKIVAGAGALAGA